jgi:hypothetical protein
LQAAWILTGTNEAVLETTIVKSGKSMKLSLATLNDEWVKTVGDSIDYTNFTFGLDFYQDRVFAQAKVSFFVEDGAGLTASIPLTVTNINVWEHFEININTLIDDGAATDLTDIDKIGFKVTDSAVTYSSYVDDVVATPPPGSVEIKLFDMGDTHPIGGTTALDDGTQYEKLGDLGISGAQVSEISVSLLGGFRTYNISDFIAGVALEIPDNELLVPGNYYAITINWVDTDLSVYGPDSSFEINYYENGWAFTTPSEANTMSIVGEFNDLMFAIYSTQDVYVIEFGQVADASPNGGSTVTIYTEDSGMVRQNVLVSGVKGNQVTVIDLRTRPAFMEKGSKLEQEYNDDFTDDVSGIVIGLRYLFIPPIVNG